MVIRVSTGRPRSRSGQIHGNQLLDTLEWNEKKPRLVLWLDYWINVFELLRGDPFILWHEIMNKVLDSVKNVSITEHLV